MANTNWKLNKYLTVYYGHCCGGSNHMYPIHIHNIGTVESKVTWKLNLIDWLLKDYTYAFCCCKSVACCCCWTCLACLVCNSLLFSASFSKFNLVGISAAFMTRKHALNTSPSEIWNEKLLWMLIELHTLSTKA